MDAVAIAGAGAEVAGAVAEAEPTSPIEKTPKLRVVEPPPLTHRVAMMTLTAR